MPREAIRPSLALARLLRDRRRQLGLSTREISARTAELGQPIPASTLTRIEQGKTDPGVRRLVQLLRIYEISPEQMADLVEVAESAPSIKPSESLRAVFDRALGLAKAGEIRRALGLLMAVRERTESGGREADLRQRTMLAIAIAARDLGQERVARTVLDELLCEVLPPALAPSVLLTASTVWLSLGSISAAAGLLREAEARYPKTDVLGAAFVQHQWAEIRLEEGNAGEALAALDDAIALYERTANLEHQARARLLRITILEQLGRTRDALAEARAVRSFAQKRGLKQSAAIALVREGRVLFRLSELDAAETALRCGLGEAVILGHRGLEFLAHYYLWRILVQTGDRQRARLEFHAARYYSRFVDERTPEAADMKSHDRKGVDHDLPLRARTKRKAPPRRR